MPHLMHYLKRLIQKLDIQSEEIRYNKGKRMFWEKL